MTEETRKLFDAPWGVEGFGTVVCVDGSEVASGCTSGDAARIARLPELYDKLMWAAVQKCPDAFLTLDECRLCTDKKCEYREIVELLKKGRDGE